MNYFGIFIFLVKLMINGIYIIKHVIPYGKWDFIRVIKINGQDPNYDAVIYRSHFTFKYTIIIELSDIV